MRVLITLILATLLTACGDAQAPTLNVERGWMRAPLPGAPMTAAYFTITNSGDTPVTIDSISSPQYGRVMLHTTREVDGTMQMRPMTALVVPAQGSATLEPGGDHLMLGEPRVTGDALESIELILSSGDAPVLSVTVPVSRTNPWPEAS